MNLIIYLCTAIFENCTHKRGFQVGPLAQLVEHNTFNVGVLGSNPKRATRKKRSQTAESYTFGSWASFFLYKRFLWKVLGGDEINPKRVCLYFYNGFFTSMPSSFIISRRLPAQILARCRAPATFGCRKKSPEFPASLVKSALLSLKYSHTPRLPA